MTYNMFHDFRRSYLGVPYQKTVCRPEDEDKDFFLVRSPLYPLLFSAIMSVRGTARSQTIT